MQIYEGVSIYSDSSVNCELCGLHFPAAFSPAEYSAYTRRELHYKNEHADGRKATLADVVDRLDAIIDLLSKLRPE